MYADYVERVAKLFDAELDTIEAVHNMELGVEFEIVLCNVLRQVLPTRFGIARGFVVNEHDEEAGDDIIIFEQTTFPTVGLRSDYLRKEKIPIEAVYAYIEAKHALHLQGGSNDRQRLQKAIAQVEKVKRLCSIRKRVELGNVDGVVLESTNAVKIARPDGFPNHRNPVFCAIFARNVRDKKGGAPLEGMAVADALQALSAQGGSEFSPDLFIFGRDTVALPSRATEGKAAYESPFRTVDANQYSIVVRPGLAFAVGLISLMYALDWIRLGTMKWRAVLSHEMDANLLNDGGNDDEVG